MIESYRIELGLRLIIRLEIDNLFDLFLQLAGAGMLGMGIWFLVDKNALSVLNIASVEGSDNLYRAASITIVVVGAVVFLTGFLGCCGAIKEHSCMLVTVNI